MCELGILILVKWRPSVILRVDEYTSFTDSRKNATMQDATRSLACLTRLCQLTSPQLLLSLWPIALRIGRLIQRFRNQPRSPQAMHDFEVELLRLLIEMGRRIVEWTLNSLPPERHLMPGELFYQNDHYRLKGLSPTRNLNCLFGKIRVWRWLYEGTEGLGLPALFPLQMELGILAGVATPALADRVGQLAAELTQRQCLDVLRQQHHVVWGTETLRKVTAGMAEAMSPFRHQAQVDQVLAWLKQAAAEGGPRKILLSVGRDGVMLPIRSFKKYREGAAATVSVFNRHGKRLGTVYLGQMPEAGQVTLSDELTCLLKDILAGGTARRYGWCSSPMRVFIAASISNKCCAGCRTRGGRASFSHGNGSWTITTPASTSRNWAKRFLGRAARRVPGRPRCGVG